MANVNVRMLPANASGGQVVGSVGPSQQPLRSYAASGGQTIDAVGGLDGDAAVLASSGLFLAFCLSGTAATRRASTPSNYFKPGTLWLDTDSLSQGVIMWDGLTWRLPTGSAVT
jgi:hypothetical protein